MEKNMEGLTCFTLELKVKTSDLSKEMKVLILESDSTPNYYSRNNFPLKKVAVNEKYFFLPVKNQINCFQDLVYRKASLLMEKYSSITGVYPGQMLLQNIEKQGIRFTLNSTDQFAKIISEFSNLGIVFFSKKNIKDYTSIITYKKYVSYKYIDDGIYQDNDNPNRFFFETSKQIEFEEFKIGIEKIKQSCNYSHFDSFLTSFIHKNIMKDYIGVYSLHCDKNRFKELEANIKNIF